MFLRESARYVRIVLTEQHKEGLLNQSDIEWAKKHIGARATKQALNKLPR